jgi:outer membrane protein W
MKRVFVTMAALLTAFLSLKAQEGSWYVGGNAGFSTSQGKTEINNTETKTGKGNNWSFSPEIGTFLTNQIQVGIGVTINGSKSDNQATPQNTETTTNSYGGTLYGRCYFGKEAFKPFIGLNASVLPGNSKSTTGNTTFKSKTMSFGANVNAGFGYALSKRVTAVGSFGFFGYNYNSSEPANSNTKFKQSSFGFDANTLGNRFNIGFYYTLN